MWITHKGKPEGIAVILGPVNYAQLLFPDFSLIVCGYLVCRYTALNRTVWEKVPFPRASFAASFKSWS